MFTSKPEPDNVQADTSGGAPKILQESFVRCLPGDSYLKFSVRAGQTVDLWASTQAACDFRGWSWNGGQGWVGPEGAGFRDNDALAPDLPIGRLIGKFSAENVEGEMSKDQVERIFRGPVWDLGGNGGQFTRVPFNGFLYLRMNDTLDFQNNRGSIQVTVQLGDVF